MKDDEGVKLSGTQSWWCSLFFFLRGSRWWGCRVYKCSCCCVVGWLGGCVCDRGVLLTHAKDCNHEGCRTRRGRCGADPHR